MIPFLKEFVAFLTSLTEERADRPIIKGQTAKKRLTMISFLLTFILGCQVVTAKIDDRKRLSNSMLQIVLANSQIVHRLDLNIIQYEVLAVTQRLNDLPKIDSQRNNVDADSVWKAILLNKEQLSADQEEALTLLHYHLDVIANSGQMIAPDQSQRMVKNNSKLIDRVCEVFDLESMGLDLECTKAKNYYAHGGYIGRLLAQGKTVPIK